MDTLSWTHSISPKTIDALYHEYQVHPEHLSIEWRRFFDGFTYARTTFPELPDQQQIDDTLLSKEFRVIELIQAYRSRGHYFTKTNPIRPRRKFYPTLDLENFGLSSEDLERAFVAGNEVGLGKALLKDILQFLQDTYCRSVGVEYMYIRHVPIVEWLQQRMEQQRNMPNFTPDEKIQILHWLAQSLMFEQFLHKRFPGQKRFSLEGNETFIVALQVLLQKTLKAQARYVVIGMAHRGRLNVLTNVLKKPAQDIFAHFLEKPFDETFLVGDVKYHLGYSNILNQNMPLEVILMPNPSHLEAVTPVVTGMARALIDLHSGDTDTVVPVIVHGDASIAGQGVVYETIQMSELEAYTVGGSIHIVINNQIGFTTDFMDARSSIYCTDVAKIIQSPIFHVNADDAEAVAYVIQLAFEYRQKFHKDVFIDLVGYRKYGHNESDEPRFTQYELYDYISKHPDAFQQYAEQLIQGDIISEAYLQELRHTIQKQFDAAYEEARQKKNISAFVYLHSNARERLVFDEQQAFVNTDTRVDIDVLIEISRKIFMLPKDKTFFPKLVRLYESRFEMIERNQVDWAMAEQLAFATLLNEGINVRMSGQDVERGTFSQRHAVLHDVQTHEEYIPLQHIHKHQGKFRIYNSLLSEYAVLGFEYGYAVQAVDDLVIWEAQYGDFANGAQIVIDQYIMSAKEKWGLVNNLVLFLPHGYEGQGPEHSSARIERYLQLCAHYNVDVAMCSTPANFYHLLRQHVLRSWRHPLILFTPKSLLRHPLCISTLDELAHGAYQYLIDDEVVNPDDVDTLVLCSGKIYYELFEERDKRQKYHVALVRLEHLYPFHEDSIQHIIHRYHKAKRKLWVQEEPVNMGAWPFLSRWLRPMGFSVVARPLLCSPAGGSYTLHLERQHKIYDKTFGNCVCERKENECRMICLQFHPESIHL